MKNILSIIIFIIIILLNESVSITKVHASLGDAEIRGNYDGSDIIIKSTARVAGSLDSLNWKGKEFVNSFDHGRQIQVAWTLNDQGECNNPTEAGSGNDGPGPTTSSILESINTVSSNQLTTVSLPAYWLAPGQPASSGCPPGVSQAANTTLTSNYHLTKTISIGALGLPNVIEFQSTVSVPEQVSDLVIQPPAAFLTQEFSNFWTYSPATDSLLNVTGQLQPTSYTSAGKGNTFNLPGILSTSDNQFAFGVYSPDIINANDGTRSYQMYNFSFNSDPKFDTNGIFANFTRGPTAIGTYNYETYLVIGSLEQVKNTLKQLYQKIPATFNYPVGWFDYAGCDMMAGWAGLLGDAMTPSSVSFFADGTKDTGSNIGSIQAITQRTEPVCTALGGSNCALCPTDAPQCNHGFIFSTPNSLKNGQQRQVYAYAKGQDGKYSLLSGSPKQISCNTPASPTSPALATITPTSTPTSPDFPTFLNLFKTYFNQSNSPSTVDLNGNGKVEIFDYNLFVGIY